MKVTQLTIAAMVAAGLTFTGISQANLNETVNDWKSYAGAFCQSHSPSNDVRRFSSGVLANWQDHPTTLYCPVVRDIAEGGSKRIKLARVSLFNNHANEGGYCRLVSQDNKGNTVDWDHFAWPAGIGNVTAELGPLSASNWGNYFIYCQIPGTYENGSRKSYIRNVRLDEWK